MNYQWHYDKLIETRKHRQWEKNLEVHHIRPKSMGGNDEEENLINLTPREHFLAHWLLWKIHRNRQMSMAFFSMCQFRKGNRKNLKFSSKAYEEARLSRLSTGVSDETRHKMSMAKLGKVYSQETRDKMSASRRGKTPWNKGAKNVVSEEARKLMSEKAQKKRKRNFDFLRKALEDDFKLSDKHRTILKMYLSGKNINEIVEDLGIKKYELNNTLRSITTKLKKL